MREHSRTSSTYSGYHHTEDRHPQDQGHEERVVSVANAGLPYFSLLSSPPPHSLLSLSLPSNFFLFLPFPLFFLSLSSPPLPYLISSHLLFSFPFLDPYFSPFPCPIPFLFISLLFLSPPSLTSFSPFFCFLSVLWVKLGAFNMLNEVVFHYVTPLAPRPLGCQC